MRPNLKTSLCHPLLTSLIQLTSVSFANKGYWEVRGLGIFFKSRNIPEFNYLSPRLVPLLFCT